MNADAWSDGLPKLVADAQRRWHLTPDGDPILGTASFVQPVLDADGVRRAFKAVRPEPDNAGEPATLQLWRGRGAVELLRADPRRGVLVLEWLGSPLSEHGDATESAEVVAGLYGVLHAPAAPQLPDGHALVRGWLDDLAGLGRRVPAPPRLVDWALRAGRALASEPGTHVVHGDLHDGNVLDRDGEWVAIDPKGFNADPSYEVAPLLWNRWDDLVATGDVAGAIRDRFHAVVDAAGLDERRCRDWVGVRCVVNLAWQVLDGDAGPDGDSRAWTTRNVTVAKAMQARTPWSRR